MFQYTYNNATSGNAEEQVECFGAGKCILTLPFGVDQEPWIIIKFPVVYPSECVSPDPPASVECMTAIFLNESCTDKGTHYPGKLSPTDKAEVDVLSVQYAKFLI